MGSTVAIRGLFGTQLETVEPAIAGRRFALCFYVLCFVQFGLLLYCFGYFPSSFSMLFHAVMGIGPVVFICPLTNKLFIIGHCLALSYAYKSVSYLCGSFFVYLFFS